MKKQITIVVKGTIFKNNIARGGYDYTKWTVFYKFCPEYGTTTITSIKFVGGADGEGYFNIKNLERLVDLESIIG